MQDEALKLARVLAEKIRMPLQQRELALGRLGDAFKKNKIEDFARKPVIGGVLAYQMGEGGFLVKVRNGKGLVRLAGGKERTFTLNSLSIGAQIGGSSEWGVGLVLGLYDPAAFGGEYEGNVRGATFAAASINITKLRRVNVFTESMQHELYLVGAAAGASANAGGIKLTLTLGP